MRRGRILILLLAGALVVGGGAAWVRALGAGDGTPEAAEPSPTGEPVYYVEGARPSPGATERPAWVEDGEAPPGCVPYSPERPGAYVCGELPPGFEPPPPPGTAKDYPEVCAVAAKVIEEQAERLSRELQLASVFEIDPSGCAAWGMGPKSEGRWTASFPLVRPVVSAEGETYRTAVVWDFTLAGENPETGGAPMIVLSGIDHGVPEGDGS